MEQVEFGRIAYLALLLAFVGSGVVWRFRGRMGEAFRMALIWAILFLAVAAAYGFWKG